jgi:hypothetical protein
MESKDALLNSFDDAVNSDDECPNESIANLEVHEIANPNPFELVRPHS